MGGWRIRFRQAPARRRRRPLADRLAPPARTEPLNPRKPRTRRIRTEGGRLRLRPREIHELQADGELEHVLVVVCVIDAAPAGPVNVLDADAHIHQVRDPTRRGSWNVRGDPRAFTLTRGEVPKSPNRLPSLP